MLESIRRRKPPRGTTSRVNAAECVRYARQLQVEYGDTVRSNEVGSSNITVDVASASITGPVSWQHTSGGGQVPVSSVVTRTPYRDSRMVATYPSVSVANMSSCTLLGVHDWLVDEDILRNSSTFVYTPSSYRSPFFGVSTVNTFLMNESPLLSSAQLYDTTNNREHAPYTLSGPTSIVDVHGARALQRESMSRRNQCQDATYTCMNVNIVPEASTSRYGL